MSLAEINGVERYSGRKNNLDLKTPEFLLLLDALFPGAGQFIVEHRKGERIQIPRTLETETKRARAQRLDDGLMPLRELAELAGCCTKTASRARKEGRRT